MPGPLPDPNRRRRNKPTIPTTALPASGRPGLAPKPPSWVELGPSGLAWWAWAWKTPQAAGWSTGDLVMVSRRAGLEDDFARIGQAENLDVADLLDVDPDDRTAELEWLVRGLLKLATGRLQLAKEARELEDRLGLTPKGLAALRWTIVDEQARAKTSQGGARPARKRRLQVVDGVAGA